MLYHARSVMPAGSRQLQASPSLTLEFWTTTTDSLCERVSEIMFHFAWPFMDPPPYKLLLCVESPLMSCYGNIFTKTSSFATEDIHRIRTLLYHRTSMSSTCFLRTCDVSKILLLCNFRPLGMIRCVGGVYTSDFLNFSSIDACLLALSGTPVDPGEPPYDFLTL